MLINVITALQLHLSSEGDCPTSRSFSTQYRESLGVGGIAETFIPYLWPRFLHVSFFQVVSRKLWHQLEQPKQERKKERGISYGGEGELGSYGGPWTRESPS